MNSRSQRLAAVVAPVVLFTAASQYEIWIGPLFGGTTVGPKPALAAVSATISLGLALRLRYPLAALVLVMGQEGLHAVFVGFGLFRLQMDLFEIFLAFVFIVYSTAARTSGRRTYAGAAIIVVTQLIAYGPSLPGSLSQAFGEWVFYSLAWALGKTLRHRELRGNRLEARTVELETQRESQIHAAIAEERARIARELHDIVGHSVSLMVLQTGAARQALDRNPEKAREPLLSVESTGRSAMTELRRLVGMLRRPGEDEELAPQPCLADVAPLIARVREAGLTVDFAVDGSLEGIPTGVDLSAFRILQEALTNVVKHAGATHVKVRVTGRMGAVEVLVQDDGCGPSEAGSAVNGHGLIGMRERVNLYGGSLDAGARDGGGFRVHARLPYEAP